MSYNTIEKYSIGTAYFKQMKDEFEEMVDIGEVLSTKILLMDDKQEINRKFNQALRIWKSYSPSKYIIDYVCTVVNFTFSYECRAKLYREIDNYTTTTLLSEDSKVALDAISYGLYNYALDMLGDVPEGFSISSIENFIICPQERFFLDYFAPITNMSLEKLEYFLMHVLKRKSIDFYDKNEFMLYVVARIKCGSKYKLLCKLKDYYEELSKSNNHYVDNEFDNSMTVFVGYYMDDTFLDILEKIDIDILENIHNNETVRNMLLWHIGLNKTNASSAELRFCDLYKKVNELYAEEIADFKIFKKNNKNIQYDEFKNGEIAAQRGEYNVSNKYDGSGEIIIKYHANAKVTLPAGKVAFISEGRFNRIDGCNYFMPCNDITFNAGQGIITVQVKCTSEKPFQMVKARKNGTVEIAERDSIRLLDKYTDNFEKCYISHKPICIYFNMLKDTGTIHDYLYSSIDRKDMLDDWFYDKALLNIDAGLLDTPWFNESRLSIDAANEFKAQTESTQRKWILLLLFMKYVKTHDLSDITAKEINTGFVHNVQYEMGDIRFEGINYGNPFDCLLSYLLLTDSPVDNLRLLYKEVDRIKLA